LIGPNHDVDTVVLYGCSIRDPIKEFPHDDKGLNFNGRWIGKYMGKTCVALLCPFTDLLAAGEFATLGVISVISLALWTTPSEFKAALWNLLKKKKPPGPPENPPGISQPKREPRDADWRT
jgi:hypothetical protein